MVIQSLQSRHSLAHDPVSVEAAFIGIPVIHIWKHSRITYRKQIWRQTYNTALTTISKQEPPVYKIQRVYHISDVERVATWGCVLPIERRACKSL